MIYIGYNGAATGIVDVTEWHDEIFSAKRQWNNNITQHGYVITRVSSDRIFMNHQTIGVGVGHRDAEFCESRGEPGEPWSSMAAYYENNSGGWWSGKFHSDGVKYYGVEPTAPSWANEYTNEWFARHGYLSYIGASHEDCPYEYCDKT